VERSVEMPLTNALSDDVRWRAMVERDARYDGQFVCAVTSTGIYCRPSCPARKPRREHVVFYPDAEAAEAAGYRPCKRCRPQAVAHEAEVVERVCRYIEAHLDRPLTLAALGREAGYSPYHLQRVFKRVAGLSPRQYVEAARVGRFKAQLKQAGTVADALYDAGFNSPSVIYDGAPASALGMSPATYRRGGAGQRIGYTIVDSSLGRLLVAATDRGVACVFLGDADDVLAQALREEFPAADLIRDDDGFRPWVEAILARLEGEEPHADLPLDVRATAFQWRVWQELQRIPAGETRSYREIAAALGQPNAARAVARACATNPVAVVIPCHRVVRGDGGMGGYRWGINRKRALLERERKNKQG